MGRFVHASSEYMYVLLQGCWYLADGTVNTLKTVCQTQYAYKDTKLDSCWLQVCSFPLLGILYVLNPAGQNIQQGLSPLLDISRSLPDMSGIFRVHCHIFWHATINNLSHDWYMYMFYEVYILLSLWEKWKLRRQSTISLDQSDGY